MLKKILACFPQKIKIFFLEKYGRFIGDVRPLNIELTNLGQIRVAPFKISPKEDTNYYKSKNNNVLTYLSPELMENLKENKNEPSYNFFKSDVYSLGIMMLELSTFCEPFE